MYAFSILKSGSFLIDAFDGMVASNISHQYTRFGFIVWYKICKLVFTFEESSPKILLSLKCF